MVVARVVRPLCGVEPDGGNLSHDGGQDNEKNVLQPHRKRQWCIRELTAEFLYRMESALRLYLSLHNPSRPVVCFDERLCFLTGSIVQGLGMKPNTPQKRALCLL